jgi:hypothetical protein
VGDVELKKMGDLRVRVNQIEAAVRQVCSQSFQLVGSLADENSRAGRKFKSRSFRLLRRIRIRCPCPAASFTSASGSVARAAATLLFTLITSDALNASTGFSLLPSNLIRCVLRQI